MPWTKLYLYFCKSWGTFFMFQSVQFSLLLACVFPDLAHITPLPLPSLCTPAFLLTSRSHHILWQRSPESLFLPGLLLPSVPCVQTNALVCLMLAALIPHTFPLYCLPFLAPAGLSGVSCVALVFTHVRREMRCSFFWGWTLWSKF